MRVHQSASTWDFARWAMLVVLMATMAASGAIGQEAESGEPAEQQGSADSEEHPLKTIKMIASNWHWRPELIRVPVGTRLRIEFDSYDASHSFVLKGYGIKVPLREGKSAEVEFVADKVGEFKWRCGRPCGNGCAKMVGKLIVE